MKITIELDTATAIALRRLAHELDCPPEDAGAHALRDHLIGLGMLELDGDEGDDAPALPSSNSLLA